MGTRRSWTVLLLLSLGVGVCWGHGRLIDPPSRASAWRYGYGTPVDYNDNEGFCGGFMHQWDVQGGKCGICGDAWDEDPRPHEAGGLYATGTIVRKYTQGQVIQVSVDITSNHFGHFEFRICPNNNPKREASQTCLNDHPLFMANDSSVFEYELDKHYGVHTVFLRLPSRLTCTQCVFQWRYVAGNNWGICEDGTGQLGCGPQEEFRACADVAIVPQKMTTEGFMTTEEESGTSEEVVTSSYSWYSTPTPDLTPTLSVTERPPPPTTSPVRSSTSPVRTTRPRTTRPRPTRPRTTRPRPTRPRTTRPRTTRPRPTRPRTTRPSPTKPRPTKPRPTKPRPTKPRPTKPRPTTQRLTTQRLTTQRLTTSASGGCRAVGVWQQVSGMDEWCIRNCNHVPSFCPASHCTCD